MANDFKVGKVYQTKMSDGALFALDSVFCAVTQDIENYTLYGKYVGYEHLLSCRIPIERLHKEVDWQQAFDHWIDIKCRQLRWKVERELAVLEEKYVI